MRFEKQTEAATLSEDLRHVYWIGGGSGAGKSTVARRIADRHGLHYATDDAMAEHTKRSTREGSPALARFMAMNMDERWVSRSPATMLETFHWFLGEGFDCIVEDLLSLPQAPPVIVEGFRLLPHLVKPLLAEPSHALWLLPTPDFREAVFNRRGGAWGFLGRTSDPERARSNLVERDRMFTDRLEEQTRNLELTSIRVDTSTTEDELVDRVERAFEL
jgi:2-phosphoglycerate kinase